MAITQIPGKQIGAQQVKRADLNTTTPGKAVITRLIAGNGITLTATGADSGTGDVTISVT